MKFELVLQYDLFGVYMTYGHVTFKKKVTFLIDIIVLINV